MSQSGLLPAGATALVVEFGDSIDRRVSAKVLALGHRLDDAPLDGIVEAVPTFRSLMVHYDPLVLSTPALSTHIAELAQGMQAQERSGRLWRAARRYGGCPAADPDGGAAPARR